MLALVHRHLIPPDEIPEGTDIVAAPWRTEFDVITTLRAMGHEVQALGVHDDLGDRPQHLDRDVRKGHQLGIEDEREGDDERRRGELHRVHARVDDQAPRPPNRSGLSRSASSL